MKFQIFFSALIASSIFLFGINIASAATILDIPSGYWAQDEIETAVSQHFLDVKSGKFRPEDYVNRAEFANGIYKVINRNVSTEDSAFSDVKGNSVYDNSILGLNQLQVIFGYPDGSFKPHSPMKRSEASSVVANIIRSEFYSSNVLNRFKDKDEVPAWATPSYISNILNGIYFNYHDENELAPNEYLSRAETAVLLVSLDKAIKDYKFSYLPAQEVARLRAEAEKASRIVPIFIGKNTLAEFKNSYKNSVQLYDVKKIIEAGNIVPVRALQRVDAKTVTWGQALTYVSPKDIYSIEGTKLYNAGTKFIASVEETEDSYWLKKQHKAYIVFNKAILSDGTEFPVAGVLYSMYNGKIVLEKKKNSIRVQKDAVKQYSKRDAAIKFAQKKLVPVVKYKDDTDDSLFMLITGDMIIPEGREL